MNKRLISALIIISVILTAVFALASCEPAPTPSKLVMTTLRLEGNTACWEAVENASGYEASVNGALSTLGTDVLSFELEDGEAFKIRALGNGKEYLTSDWSNTVTYTAGGSPDPQPGDGDHVHINKNGDTLCDGCGETVVIIVDFYSINDLHGKFCDTDSQPGVDELAAYLRSREDADDNVVILSTGDMWQGSAESNLTYGKIMTEWMNELGFVSMTLGNHEYDWGSEYIRSNLAIADFPFLAINVYDAKTNERVDYCAPSVLINEGGIDIGIIGAIGDCYSSIASDMVEDVYFKTGADLAALVRAESVRLRELGAEIIVYALHDGYGRSGNGVQNVTTSSLSGYYSSTLSSGGYVDLVFEGHSHQRYILKDTNGIYHLQGGGENSGISHVEIAYDLISESTEVKTTEIVRSDLYASYDDDPATEELEDKYGDIIDKAYEKLGSVSNTYDSDSLADLMAELYLECGIERWGNEYDIVLAGGYIKPRAPYDLYAGNHTYADIISLFPFNNRIVLCSISGEKLLERFIDPYSSDYHCAMSEYGNTIKNTVNPEGTYYIVVDTYSSLYTPNGLTVVKYLDDTTFARDLLSKHIADGRLDMTQNEYTLTSIEDVLEIGSALGDNEETKGYYYVKGRVISEPHPTWGNLYITDESGNRLWIYGLYDARGNRYDSMHDKPTEGDEIIVSGKILKYVNPKNPSEIKIEISNAVCIEIA